MERDLMISSRFIGVSHIIHYRALGIMFRDRCVQRNMLHSSCHELFDIECGCLEHFCKLFRFWLSMELLLKSMECFVHLVYAANLVEGKPDYPRLFCQCLEDGLPDPPHCIGDEFESSRLVESHCCLYESEIPFVDEIGE